MKKNQFLRVCLRIFSRFVKRKEHYGLFGDVEEMYHVLKEESRFKANLWIWSHLVKTIPSILSDLIFWKLIMFRNYFKITIRIFKKQKGYSFINVTGLATGIACCLLSLLWIQDEWSFDRFHKNHDSLYRVIRKTETGQGIQHGARTPAGLAGTLMEEFPEVVNTSRFLIDSNYGVRYNDHIFVSDRVGIVDPSFLEMFTFPLIMGDKTRALSSVKNVVITKRMADKLFGGEDPMGKTIDLGSGGDLRTITGILQNIPHNSHLRFDILIPIDWGRINRNNWKSNFFYTFVQLQKHVSDKAFEKKITGLVRKHVDDVKTDLTLQPLSGIYFHSNNITDTFIHGDIKYTYIFSSMAALILLIACINFMNLSTARSSTRALEVGMRKVIGAKRSHLVMQFMGESFVFSFLGLFLALMLARLALPLFNGLAEKNLTMDLWRNMSFFTGLICIALLTGVISGSYPALHLLRFQPVRVLKSTSGSGRKGALFRRILVVIQFSLTICLLIGTFVVHGQLQYIHNRDLGFEKDDVIKMSRDPLQRDFDSIRTELLENPDVVKVTYGFIPASPRLYGGETDVDWEGKDPNSRIALNRAIVWYDYLETFRLELVEGRTFSRDFSTDETEAFIVNETAVQMMGLESPIGKRMSIRERQGSIVGVVKDFHWACFPSCFPPALHY